MARENTGFIQYPLGVQPVAKDAPVLLKTAAPSNCRF